MYRNTWPAAVGGGKRAEFGTSVEPDSDEYRTTRTQRRQSIRRSDGRIVGEVNGDSLVKKVRGSKHRLRVPSGWAIDVAVLVEAEAMGAKRVEVVDTESGTTYHTDMGTLWRKGVEFNRGHGRQILLGLGLWCRDGEPNCEQLSLFDLIEAVG